MTFRVVHEIGDQLQVYHGDNHLFTYVYRSKDAAVEAPRPYFHPIKTLAGDTITIFRPHDHRWHHGLSFVLPHVNGHNFWGGNTYVHGQGYLLLDNIGWQSAEANEFEGYFRNNEKEHFLTQMYWITHAKQIVMLAYQQLILQQVNAEQGWYQFTLKYELHNQTREPLEIGSPTTQGRPKAGYGGLFWRGTRDMTGGKILMSDGREALGDENTLMGERSAWVAFTSPHDDVDRASTIILVDHQNNPRHPTQWFVRAGAFAGLSASFMFDQVYVLEPDSLVKLTYHVIVANGQCSHARIQELVNSLPE